MLSLVLAGLVATSAQVVVLDVPTPVDSVVNRPSVKPASPIIKRFVLQPTSLTPGVLSESSISGQNPQVSYRFEATNGEQFHIEINASTDVSVLVLKEVSLGRGIRHMARGSARGLMLLKRVPTLMHQSTNDLLKSHSYYLIVSKTEEAANGEISVRLSRHQKLENQVPIGLLLAQQVEKPLNVNVPVVATLSPESTKLTYKFDLKEKNHLYIRVKTSGKVMVKLLDRDKNLVRVNDSPVYARAVGGFNATIDSTGLHVLKPLSERKLPAGRYYLDIELAKGQQQTNLFINYSTERPEVFDVGENLSTGIGVGHQTSIAAKEEDLFRFSANPKGVVNITTQTSQSRCLKVQVLREEDLLTLKENILGPSNSSLFNFRYRNEEATKPISYLVRVNNLCDAITDYSLGVQVE